MPENRPIRELEDVFVRISETVHRSPIPIAVLAPVGPQFPTLLIPKTSLQIKFCLLYANEHFVKQQNKPLLSQTSSIVTAERIGLRVPLRRQGTGLLNPWRSLTSLQRLRSSSVVGVAGFCPSLSPGVQRAAKGELGAGTLTCTVR